jgi:hypothetical protein
MVELLPPMRRPSEVRLPSGKPMNGLLRLVALAVLLGCRILPAHAETPPKFADYPVKVYKGKPAKPRLVTQYLRDYRELFEASSDKKVDAGGRYIVVKMGCGSSCVAPALMDASSGKIIEFFTVSGWREIGDDFDPVASRADSRLIVFRGARNEKGVVGDHYYLIEDGGKLKHLHTVDTHGNFETTPKIK